METETQEQKRDLWWGIVTCLKTIGWIFLAVLPQNLIMLAVALPQSPDFKDFKMSPAMNWVISILLIAFTVFVIWLLWRYYKKHTSYETQKIGWKDIGVAFGIYILLRIVVSVGMLLNKALTGNQTTSNDAGIQSLFTNKETFPGFIILISLSIAIVAPIVEELAFRGIFIDLWFKKHRKWLPAVITSSLFGLAHGFDNIITFLIYFSIGLGLFFAYYRRHNIKDSMLLHALNNIPGAILMLVQFFTL